MPLKLTKDFSLFSHPGISNVRTIRIMLKDYVKELHEDALVQPQPYDNSWYPSRRDIKNYVYKTTWLKKLSQIDQV